MLGFSLLTVDVETINALLSRMSMKIRFNYSLGQVGELLTDHQSGNGEVTAVDSQMSGNGTQLHRVISQVDPEAKVDFRHAAEVKPSIHFFHEVVVTQIVNVHNFQLQSIS